MKTDFELVRAILLAVGKNEDAGGGGFIRLNIPGQSLEEVLRHVEFLCDEGLIEAVNLTVPDGGGWKPARLTERGREFLASAHDEDSWKRAGEKLGRKKNSFVGILKQALFDLVTSVLGF